MARFKVGGGFLKKVQLPVIGGIRKVITPGSNVAVGTTIAEIGSNTVSLAQLAAILAQIQEQQKNTGGGNIGNGTEAVLKVGPGLSGGGPLLGTVLLNLTAPIPWGLDDGGGGGDGDAGPPGQRGVNGANGATGGTGPAGPAIFLAGDDGIDGDFVPGGVGPAGLTGAAGPTGPAGTTLVYVNTTVPAGNTVSNTSSETFFTSAYTVPANSLVIGSVLRVKLFGVYSTGVVAPSLALKIYFGATVLIASGTLTTVAGVTNDGWSAEGLFTIQTIGASGTIEAQGLSEFSTASTAVLFVNMDNTAPVTVDTTIAESVRASVQWGGTVNASDTITLREMTVEVMSVAGIPATPVIPIAFPIFFGEDGVDGDMGPPGVPGTGSSGSSAVAVPGTIPSLTFWWESDNILGVSGGVTSRLQEKTPWITGVAAANPSGTVAISSTQLNSLNTLTWPAATAGGTYVMPTGFTVPGEATIFIVAKGSTSAGNQAIFGGPSGTGALGLYLAVGTAAIALLNTGVAVVGTCSTAWVAGTWFQANVTYTASTGAFAFRQSRAAANSGTGSTGAGASLTSIFGDDNAGGGAAKLNAASLAAVIIYNRVLTAGEITSVENYLNTKWGV